MSIALTPNTLAYYIQTQIGSSSTTNKIQEAAEYGTREISVEMKKEHHFTLNYVERALSNEVSL